MAASMFNRALAAFLLTLVSAAPGRPAGVPPEIEDETVNSHDRLPPRVAVWPAPDAAGARTSRYPESPWARSLNGTWRFHWAPDPASRPEAFYETSFDASSWREIPVPSTWERQGYGVPLYVNYTYPFKVDPPRVMGEPPREYTTFAQRNPVGSYRRTFEVPADWAGRRIVLHFAGVSSAFFVWVNGERVGYSEDSRVPAEFDVTPFVRGGENLLAVEVYKYCDGSYLEDQDFWRLGGLFSDVFLRAVPEVALWDVYAQPVLDAALAHGAVVLHVTPANFTARAASGLTTALTLLDPRGRRVGAVREQKLDDVAPGFGDERRFPAVDYGAVALWSDEEPAVYTAIVELRRGRTTLEAYALPVGFRRLEIRGTGLALNGREMKVRGVNRHDFDPDQGYTVPQERRVEDVRLMKQANINFVRNSHYPMDARWYTLTSAMGLMVLDEANVESHGLSYHKRVLPGDQPGWSAACVERMRRMVIRDRQFPSVVMWSLGNEAGWGTTFLAMREATHAADPERRLIQYADMNKAADLDSQTYPTPDWLRQHLEGKAVRKGERGEASMVEQHGPYPSGRPFLLNEYAHAMGNSVGNLQDYWDVFDSSPMLVGGFIWDWVDQALAHQTPDGRKGYVYGGDFGDQPNNLNSCCDGLVAPDRAPHPSYAEVQKVYQPVRFRALEDGGIAITNRHVARNLSAYALEYEVTRDGAVVRRGAGPALDIAPGASRTVRLFDGALAPGSGEAFLTVRLRLRDETPWAPAGHVVAWEQIALNTPSDTSALPAITAGGRPDLAIDDDTVTASGPSFTARFDRRTGLLASWRAGDRELVSGPMRFNFWRAATDNDRGWKVEEKMRPWKTAGREAVADATEAAREPDGTIAVQARVRIPVPGASAEVRHVVHGDGTIDTRVRVVLPAGGPEPVRLGLQCEIPGDLAAVRWFGRGPHESYADRHTSAAVGLYETTVARWITPYVRPQENANRTGVRWMRFEAADGRGLRVQAPASAPLSVSAWPYSQDDLAAARHDFELPRREATTLNLDHQQMGVGGDNSWGAEVHREYRIVMGRTYEWTFRLQPSSR